MKTIECPYWIVANDEELQKVLAITGKPVSFTCTFPYFIGTEEGRVFQHQNINDPMNNYYSRDGKETLKYVLKEIPE